MGYSILLVDDDRAFIEGIKSSVHWDALKITAVYTKSSVKESIALLSKISIDIVLCDIEMPGGSGLDLLMWIRKQQVPSECIILSSYADFSYAQSALRFNACDYLLKPIKHKDLEKSLLHLVCLLDEKKDGIEDSQKNLWASLFDNSVSQEEFTDSMRKTGLPDCLYFAFVLLKFVPIPSAESFQPRCSKNLISQIIWKVLGEKWLYSVVCLGEDRWILVFRLTREREYSDEQLTALISTLEPQLSCKEICAYCGEKGTVGQAAAMREKIFQLEKRAVPNMQKFARESDLPPDRTIRRRFPFKEWRKMLVGMGSLSELVRSISDEIVCVQTEKGWTVNRLTAFMRDFTLMLNNYFQSRESSLEEAIDLDEYERMEEYAVSSLKAATWFIREMIKVVEGSKNHKNDAITTVCQYINENLGEELSRKMLAKLVFMSENYLSKQFIRSMKMTLPAYISKQRMEKAKELLEYPDMKIGKVAISVGYSNFSYFTKIFHDYTGLTPNEWRLHSMNGVPKN